MRSRRRVPKGLRWRRLTAPAVRRRKGSDPIVTEIVRIGSDPLPDADARARAVDPAHNVVLEASAGTGKTHVLVDRYLNLLSCGVDPANILAITFTRKAAAEMRGRILNELRTASRRGRPAQGPLARRARALGRHCHQHDRRVLPFAASRVSARGQPRSGLRDG